MYVQIKHLVDRSLDPSRSQTFTAIGCRKPSVSGCSWLVVVTTVSCVTFSGISGGSQEVEVSDMNQASAVNPSHARVGGSS
jgi:hypothetical protein